MGTSKRALDIQISGGHYKDMRIQPAVFNHHNNMPYIEGCIIKYLVRWRNKNGIDDLRKASHFLQILIDLEEEDEKEATKLQK